jgi:hypothetical protein
VAIGQSVAYTVSVSAVFLSVYSVASLQSVESLGRSRRNDRGGVCVRQTAVLSHTLWFDAAETERTARLGVPLPYY